MELGKPRCWPAAGSPGDWDRDKEGEQQELSHSPHPQGGEGAGRDVLCGTHSPTLSCSSPSTLTLLPSPAPDTHLGFRGSPTTYPPLSLQSRGQAELPSPSLSCQHAGERGTELWGLGTPLCLQPGTAWPCPQARPRSEGSTDTSMSPSPRCSAASLVNWESEMKHCSSGREELAPWGRPATGTSDTRTAGPWLQEECSSQSSRQRASRDRRVGRLFLAAEGPLCLLRTPSPALGTSGRGPTGTGGVWAQQGRAGGSPHQHQPHTDLDSSEEAGLAEPGLPCPQGPVFPGIP